MSSDDAHDPVQTKTALPDVPGEEVLAHQGVAWRQAAISKLSPLELVEVAETGIPPAVHEIIIVDLDEIPLHPVGHPEFEKRKVERIRIAAENARNEGKQRRLVMRSWDKLFDMVRSACDAHAPMLAQELFDLCNLESQGITGGHFDGPRAWRIVNDRIQGDGERTKHDKEFYSTALAFQKAHPLADGCSAADYQKRAHAFISRIMPHLAQKYSPHDAADYVVELMPKSLKEAGKRIQFTTKLEGRHLDLKYLARLCREEVFAVQKATPTVPTLASFDELGGHDVALMSLTTGVDLAMGSADSGGGHPPAPKLALGAPARSWCPKCPHPRGTCICDPYCVQLQ